MSKAKPLVFIMMGLALGYVCHRLSLLYDELNHLPVLERWTYLLMNGQDEIAAKPWAFDFTLYSSLWFLAGLGAMGLTYLYTTSGAKVYREGQEYGSARFGTKQESQAFASKNPFLDTILAKTVRLTLLEKKRPKFDRNKNLVVIGGSGAGKTFRFVKPNLIQANCSNIVVDPKDHLPQKTGKFFLKAGYQIKILDLVSMMTSNGFNPFRYVETENDLNRMLTVYFNNTKGNGSRSDPFWDEASMTLVRAIASYLVDFYNPPKTRAQLMEEARLSKKERKTLQAKEKQDLEDRRKRGRYPSFAEISKLIKLLHKADGAEKSVLEVMFERYAKTYGTENFTMRNWADFQNYKDKTLDSVIAVTTAKFALFNIQSVIDLTKTDTMDIKSWGVQKTMVYLVIPDNDSTFRFLSALFFSTVFSTLTRQADVAFKGKIPIHVRAYLDEFANGVTRSTPKAVGITDKSVA
ncbi:Type IV secretory pathway, VirD4 component [Streptococcus equi subsp. zooepidemicus Sz5]|nr:Type IV secretory pathway, VirD4 component [Streptococcus equi subsp. zooepidemicus Sz5]